MGLIEMFSTSWRLFLSLTVLVSFFSLGYASEASVVEQHGRLKVVGNKIVGEHGKPVALHGMSLFWSQWMGKYYNRDAVKWLRDDWGCTIIRAAMGVEKGGYLKNPEKERRKVEAVVDAAIELGIYVIIDWHSHLKKVEKESIDFFSQMSKKYGKYPNVIFETWNEPQFHHSWSKIIKPYHENVISAIRKEAPHSLVICGTRSWGQKVLEAARDPIKASNVAYTFHFYSDTHKGSLRNQCQQALDLGVALFASEWGTCTHTGDGKYDFDQAQIWLDFMDKNHISWCNWSIADKVEKASALKPGANPKGGWKEEDLTLSGNFLREAIRERRSRK